MTITSQHNRKLKEIRKLRMRRRVRERARQFVAEGEDLLAAADAAGWEPVERYCAAGSGLPGTEVDPEALTRAAGLASGTRALAVYEERWSTQPTGPLCVYLYGVHDPGNVGAILRSAEAFGATSVAFGPGSADPFSPKAVRASMGSLFAVPVARARQLDKLPGETIALVPQGGRSLTALATHEPLTLVVGSEREGLPADLIEQANHVAHIPIRSHSLNAAMAAAIALYEVTRMARE